MVKRQETSCNRVVHGNREFDKPLLCNNFGELRQSHRWTNFFKIGLDC